ncbi:unnamed protein product [Caenorhabditis nigoni]|nr:hypothetical protein B9Z55_004864 [Caenorhabditis nigoni]
MTESRKGVALRELYWKTLVLGSHYPAEFDGGRFRTPPGDSFPMDIVIGLDKIANVYKVVIDADEYLTPSKVTIRVGQGKLNEEVNYKNARTSKFQKPVVLEFHRRERSVSRLESKNAFTDAVGQYIWITIEKPIPLSQNPHNQIEIKKLTVLGYPLPEELLRRTPIPESPKLEQNDEDDVTSLKMEKLELEPKGVPKKEKKIERHSYEGDGMSMKEETNLSGDPLTSIRTIRRVLEQKMEKANFDGKTIQATVCLRAIQRIDEYEARIEDLATRRSRALEAGDLEMAERHRLAMIDCRDTVFRAVHVDLLLDRDELRAIGVQSEWAD